MSCLGRAAVPVRRVWRGLRARLGLRRTAGKFASYTTISLGPDDRSPDDGAEGVGVLAAGGLGRLRTEVRSCEYRDVHVMWEMLGNPGAGATGGATPDVAAGKASGRTTATTRGRRSRGKPVAWRRLAAYCCAL